MTSAALGRGACALGASSVTLAVVDPHRGAPQAVALLQEVRRGSGLDAELRLAPQTPHFTGDGAARSTGA
jgi:hypothetical protein